MKSTILMAALLASAGLGLTACGEEAPVEEAAAKGVPGLTVTDGRLVLNAVAGNPAAVYFSLDYEGDRGLALRKAEVEGAESAMIHEYGDNMGQREMMEALPITLSKGTKLEFKPGEKHVMAMGISPDLKPGGTTNVTLTVSGGGTVTFPVVVKAAGDDR